MGELLHEVQAEDLLKFGLIPEFVGRLPVIATLDELDEDALVDILTEPKNALVKQYQKLFEFEDVRLRFTDGALRAVARQALTRKSGARGLRAILENVMLDLMYDIPSRDDVEECVISEEVIEQGSQAAARAQAGGGVGLSAAPQRRERPWRIFRDDDDAKTIRAATRAAPTRGRSRCCRCATSSCSRTWSCRCSSGRQKSIEALEEAMNGSRELLLCRAARGRARRTSRTSDDIYEVGTLGTIIQLLRLPDGTVKVLVEGKARARIRGFVERRAVLLVEDEPLPTTRRRTASRSRRSMRTRAHARSRTTSSSTRRCRRRC